MLSDNEIERASAQLGEYRKIDALTGILDNYTVLIEQYKRLKSDYEEERDSREKYKKMAKEQERDPFVLVLIDGDGYIFQDSLVTNGSDGGSMAAQLLNDTVKASMVKMGLEHCQVMVRVYANVSGLSKVLARTGLVGQEARSLSNFVASFNRQYGLMDFVDAGILKENADFKIRHMLHLYAESAQCKHIYFAACHDVGYISELTPYTGNSARFTLIRARGVRFHDEFSKLGLGIEELPNVFRTSLLDTTVPYQASKNGFTVRGNPSTILSTLATNALPVKAALPDKDSRSNICKFYPGSCKFGQSCKNLHIDRHNNASWRAKETSAEPKSPYDSLGTPSTGSPDLTMPFGLDVSSLPSKADIPAGNVAVNKNSYRLDPLLARPNPDADARLHARIGLRRLCNNFQLAGSCDSGDRCEYDHEPIDEECRLALERLARTQPCARRGACRVDACTQGHICQDSACKHRGGKSFCKLPLTAHTESLSVARFVPAVLRRPHQRTGPGLTNPTGRPDDGDDDDLTTTSTSAPDEDDEDGGGNGGISVEYL